MTDTEFLAALNVDYPGLAKVKTAVESGDLQAAKHEFAEYLRHREKPVYKFDWRARPKHDSRPANVDTAEADRILQRDLPSVSVRHKFDGEIDWTLNPINYREWPWQLNRHAFWVTLGRAYWATGDEKYAKEFVYQMTDWVRKCPVPLDKSGNDTPTWRTIEAGIRMGQTWPEAYYLFLTSPSFTDDAIVTMLKSFAEHARHLMKWPTSANWLTMECNGLMHVGVLFPEFKEAADWRKTASNRLYKELDRQVYPDGAQIELSTGYHQVSLSNFIGAWEIAHLNDVPLPEDYVAKMGRMFDYDLEVCMPNWCLPGLNDAGLTDVRSMLARGLSFFPQRSDYRWVATSGKEGTKPAIGSIALPFSGHIVMRTGWEPQDLYMLFDAGPFGYGHQHEDALSFAIYAYGKYLLVDPGNYAYDSSEWRKYVLSTRAHNTIMVDDLPQHRAGRPRQEYVLERPMPIKWASGAKFDYASSSYDDGYGAENAVKVEHARSVLFVKPEYWIVVDCLTPADDKPHKYDSMFHLDTPPSPPLTKGGQGGLGADVDASSKSVRTTNADAANLTILPLAGADLTVSVISGQETPVVQGWMPFAPYKCRPIPTPIFETTRSGPTSLAYVIYPTKAGEKCPVEKVEPLAVTPPSPPLLREGEGGCARAVGLSIRFADGRTDYFVQTDTPGKVRFVDFESDGTVTYVRTEGGRVTAAMIADGTRLSRAGDAITADVLAIGDLSRTKVKHKF